MPRRKKPLEPAALPEEKLVASSTDINVNELFARLKEFENKALLDRLKLLERSIALVQKAQFVDHAILKEIKQHVSYLSLAHEELLNNLTSEDPVFTDVEDHVTTTAVEKVEKKWN